MRKWDKEVKIYVEIKSEFYAQKEKRRGKKERKKEWKRGWYQFDRNNIDTCIFLLVFQWFKKQKTKNLSV